MVLINIFINFFFPADFPFFSFLSSLFFFSSFLFYYLSKYVNEGLNERKWKLAFRVSRKKIRVRVGKPRRLKYAPRFPISVTSTFAYNKLNWNTGWVAKSSSFWHYAKRAELFRRRWNWQKPKRNGKMIPYTGWLGWLGWVGWVGLVGWFASLYLI